MKKVILLSVLIFAAAFFGSYLGLCYLVPGWRIKLAADPLTYFVKSIGHMAPLKGVIALAVGAVPAGIFLAAAKER